MTGVWITCYVSIAGLSGVVAHATEADARARAARNPDTGIQIVFLPWEQSLWDVV